MEARHTGWHASVDYFRGTWTNAPWEGFATALDRIAYKAHTRSAQGVVGREEERIVLGYKGKAYGNTFWGHGTQGYLLQASGGEAHEAAYRAPGPERVPRLDIQLTVWYEADHTDLAERLSDVVLLARGGNESAKWRTRLVKGFGGGDTLYVGDRGGSNGRLIRIYDKYRESGLEGYRNAWRYEIELTNRQALYAYTGLRGGTFEPATIGGMVSQYLLERGIVLPPMGVDTVIETGAVPRPPTTDESRIRWLKAQVRPALDKLEASGWQREYLMSLLFDAGADGS